MKIGRAVAPAQPLAVGVLQSEPEAWATRAADSRISMAPNAATVRARGLPGCLRGNSRDDRLRRKGELPPDSAVSTSRRTANPLRLASNGRQEKRRLGCDQLSGITDDEHAGEDAMSTGPCSAGQFASRARPPSPRAPPALSGRTTTARAPRDVRHPAGRRRARCGDRRSLHCGPSPVTARRLPSWRRSLGPLRTVGCLAGRTVAARAVLSEAARERLLPPVAAKAPIGTVRNCTYLSHRWRETARRG